MTEATATPAKTVKKAPKASKSPAKKSSPKSGLFAVIATGGKQYRVQAGSKLKIEILPGEHQEGETLTFDSVLMTDNGGSEVTLGNPFIKGSVVTATLKKIGRAAKVTVIKYKQKSRYFKKNGHRQPYFEIEIDSVK
jgi:large subunit ribosomal protein L21